ncbi:type VII secretion integral membrane protein EccD [Streptomyces sp. GbtcB6]|uniref:type VII secretion integral membrane protein EccD n=1 Tax=Streptomyces sp. GbtcB6 TaxID=2824751 RepID=UPI001C2FDE77|nr:type VII secretion integral membrane protein EccD [Streptomyces sp. GbtcB6]
MTTSTPPLQSTPPDVCRLTVQGPAGRADLAVPLTLPVAALLPVLLRHAGLPDDGSSNWVLQRIGDEPLDPDGTPQTLGLRHGEVLWLRAAEEALPGLHFDDVADGVAHVVGGQRGRWTPAATRVLALTGAGLVLVVLLAALLRPGPGAANAAAAGAAALLLAAGCVAADRYGTRRATAVPAGCGALALGVLAGLASRPAAGGGYRPDGPGLLLAALWVTVLAGPLLALRALPDALPGAALLTAVSTAAACGLAAAGCSPSQAVAVVAAALFVLGRFGPRTALRLARLRAPQLPHNADELQQDIEPQPEERIRSRTRVAGALLDTLAVTTAVLCLAAWWLLAHRTDWVGWVLPLVFGTAVALQARELTGITQRVSTAVAGLAGPVVVLLVDVAPHGTGARMATAATLLLAAGGLLLAAERLPGRRLLPVWGQLGDITEWVTAIALLPLLFQLLHAYAWFRSLAG